MTACLCLTPQPETKTRNAMCVKCRGTIVSCPDHAAIYPDGTYVAHGRVYNPQGEELSLPEVVEWAKKKQEGICRKPNRAVARSPLAWMAM
jgi:hypothetical protein